MYKVVIRCWGEAHDKKIQLIKELRIVCDTSLVIAKAMMEEMLNNNQRHEIILHCFSAESALKIWLRSNEINADDERCLCYVQEVKEINAPKSRIFYFE